MLQITAATYTGTPAQLIAHCPGGSETINQLGSSGTSLKKWFTFVQPEAEENSTSSSTNPLDSTIGTWKWTAMHDFLCKCVETIIHYYNFIN